VVTFKSKETVLGELRSFLKQYNRSLDTGDNSLTKDFILTPQAIGGSIVFEQIETVNDSFILSQQTSDQLNIEGGDYELERSAGQVAVVNVVFFTDTLPTADILIPAGTQVQTAGTTFVSPVDFQTVSEYSVNLASVSLFFSYDRNRYEFPVACKATAVGTNGNVGSNIVSVLIDTVSQITGVANLSASSGGADAESDSDFRQRIQRKKTGRDLNTRNGASAYVTSQSFVDAYAVRVEDADSERPTGIDVFVIDSYLEAVVETFTYFPGIPRYYFTNLPVAAVTSVIDGVGGVVSPASYDVTLDTTTILRRSSRAQEYISIRNSASLISGSAFTVSYTHRADISQLQDSFSLNSNDVLTADILVKRAYPLALSINATLTLKTNADGPTTRNRVRNALVQFLATYRLGANIQKSDLIVVMQEGYGDFAIDSVDAVIVNSYFLTDEFGDISLPVDEVITVQNKQYATSGTYTIL